MPAQHVPARATVRSARRDVVQAERIDEQEAELVREPLVRHRLRVAHPRGGGRRRADVLPVEVHDQRQLRLGSAAAGARAVGQVELERAQHRRPGLRGGVGDRQRALQLRAGAEAARAVERRRGGAPRRHHHWLQLRLLRRRVRAQQQRQRPRLEPPHLRLRGPLLSTFPEASVGNRSDAKTRRWSRVRTPGWSSCLIDNFGFSSRVREKNAKFAPPIRPTPPGSEGSALHRMRGSARATGCQCANGSAKPKEFALAETANV